MQIRLFTIPAFEGAQLMEEMNAFLRNHRVLEVREEFFSTEQGAYWCFSIRFISSSALPSATGRNREKIDYKNVLDAAAFKLFSELRACRKEIAQEEAVPAYAIFTDAELAKIAQLEELQPEKLDSIPGIGKKKVEKYGTQMIQRHNKNHGNEKSGKSDT
jgi:superfamily II DNA helicase RecQ